MTKRCASLLFALLLSVAVAAPSFAQETAPPAMPAAGPPPAPVAWSNLSPDQQRLLSRFGSQWSTLPPARQQALAHGSERWLGMSGEQLDQARERFQHFQTM